jgi:uncharacterized repeat protein (TIGR01451 family)
VVGVVGAGALGLPSAAVAQSQCPNPSPSYNGQCGPTFTLPQWGDAGGWTEPDQFETIRFGAVLGNGREQLIGKSANGIEIWDFDTTLGQWRPAVDAGGKPMILTGFADPPPLTASRPSYGGTDWTAPEHSVSIQVGDVLGTGRDQIIARADPGMTIFSYTPGANGAPGSWSQPYAGEPFSDGDGFGFGGIVDIPGILATSTIRTADLTGDGKDDLFAVTPDGTLVAYEWNGGGFTALPATNVSIPLFSTERETVLASPPIAGRQEIWWAGPFGVRGVRLNAAGTGWSFVPQNLVEGVFSPFPLIAFGQSPAYYGTIRIANVLGSTDRQFVGRGSDGLEVFRLGADGTWQRLPTLTALSDANGFNQEQYWSSVRYADLDGSASGQQEVIARGPGGVVAYRYDDGAGQWDQLPGSIALTDDPWSSDPSYYDTLRVGDASGDGGQDTLIARGPYGIRTWFYNRPNQLGWGPYLPAGYPAFTGNQAAAYTALNGIALERGWLTGDQTAVRQIWTGVNEPTGLDALQLNLAAFCTGQQGYTPPTYQSCTPPATAAGYTAQDWTAVLNELLAEAWSAEKVTDFYNELDGIRQKTFNVESANLPALAGQLNLSAATNTPTSFSLVSGFSAGLGSAAALTGIEQPEVSMALWVAAEVVSAIPSASPSLTSQFDGTYNQMQAKFADGVAEAQTAVASQSLQVRSDPNLARLVAELRQAGTWTLDDTGVVSASNQGFALWVYKTLLPLMYTRYDISGCQNSTGDWDLYCDGPAPGSGVVGAAPQFTVIGPPPTPDSGSPGTPCRTLYTQYGAYGDSCTFQALDPSIGDRVWGLVSDNCTYHPGSTSWTPSCNLGVDPATSVLQTLSMKESWGFPTYEGTPKGSIALGGAAVRMGTGSTASLGTASLGQAASVRLYGLVRGERRLDLSRARVVVDRVLYDRSGAGELVRRRPAGGARASAVTRPRPRSLGGTRLRNRGGGVFRRHLRGARGQPGPTVELKLDQRPRHHLAFDLRLKNVSLPVLHAACDRVLARRPGITFTLHTRVRILHPGHAPFVLSIHPHFRCERDATGAVRALSVVADKRPKLGRGLSVRIRPARPSATGDPGTLTVAVRNPSRKIPAQDVIVSAYLPPGMRVIGRPRAAQVHKRRVTWRVSKLRRRHAQSFRVSVVSARAGRRCTSVSVEAILLKRATARACDRRRPPVGANRHGLATRTRARRP